MYSGKIHANNVRPTKEKDVQWLRKRLQKIKDASLGNYGCEIESLMISNSDRDYMTIQILLSKLYR